MKFLYARVSSNDGSQKIDRQTTEIEKYDEVFEDYASGGMLLKFILLTAWLAI